MTTGVNAITDNFKHAFEHFATIAGQAGMHLAYSLAGLTLVLSVIMMIVMQDELSKMFSKLLQIALLYGLFFTLIKFAGYWLPEILNSFMAIGAKAAGLGSLSPGSVFNVGENIALKMFTLSNSPSIHWYNLGVIFAGEFCGFFVLIIYAFITAEVVIVLIKSYALVAMGPIIFALGNSDFTRSAVTNYIRKVIGIGIHLMVLYVIVGVGITLGNLWINQFINSGELNFVVAAVLPMLGGLIVLYLVMKNVPAFLAEISGAGGFRNYGDAAVAAAVAGAASLTKAMNSAGKVGAGGLKAGAGTVGAMGGFGHGAYTGARDSYSAGMDGRSFNKENWKAGIGHGVKSLGVGAGKGSASAFRNFGKGTNMAHEGINTVKKSVKQAVTGDKSK